MRAYNIGTSGIGLLYIFFIASKVAGENGPFSISVSSPEVCTVKTFTYSSEMAMATGSFDIDPGLYGMGNPGQKWTFTVNAGIVLDSDTWGDDGQHIGNSIIQNADGSYTFTVPSDGIGGMMTGVANAPGCDPNKPWLEIVGAPDVTSNASIASSQTVIQSNLLSQSSLSSSVGPNAGGLSSQVSNPTGSGSSNLGSGPAASLFSSSGSYSTYTGTGLSGSTAMSINSHTSTAGAPEPGSASSGASISDFSPFPGSSTFATQTSQAIYVNPNPFGCSEIIPSEINPILYATVTGVSCVCQGTTLPLLPTVSNCGYQILPSALPASTTSSATVSQTSFISLTTVSSSIYSSTAATVASAFGTASGSSASISGDSDSNATAAGVSTASGSTQGSSASVSGISSSVGAGIASLLSGFGSAEISSSGVSTGSNSASTRTASSVSTVTLPMSNTADSDGSTAVSYSFASLGTSSLGSLGSSGFSSSPTSEIASLNSQISPSTASTLGGSSPIFINSLFRSSDATSLASWGSSGSSPLSTSTSAIANPNSRTSPPTASTFGASSSIFINSLFGSSGSASPGSSASVGAFPTTTSLRTQSAYSTSLGTGLGTMLSPSTSLAATATGCPGTPQCVLVPKGFDDQCLDADWAYCYCSGSPAPLVTSWMGSLVMPNCDYSTIPPSQCPGNPVIPYVPTESAASIVEVNGKLVIHSKLKRAIPATSFSSASCAMTSGAPQSFTLTVSATLPCTGPTTSGSTAIASISNEPTVAASTVVPVPCIDNYIPPLTTDQWQAQGVDEFWQMYYDNTSHWQELGLMKQFFEDFSGGEAGDGSTYVCTATNEEDCTMLQGCSLIATGPETWLSPHKTQAFYIWAGMTNFSKLLNMIWQALEWTAQDMDLFAGEIGSKFQVELPGATLWSKVFPILNTILTLLAIAFIIAEVPIAVGVLIGLAASFGLAADVDAFISSASQAEVTIETIYSDLGFSQGWIQTLQENVNTMHNAIWYNGSYSTNTSNARDAKQLMTGGTYLSSAQILAAADLNSTDHQNTNSGPTNGITNWFENLLAANLINNWFKSNNVYIVYIPYGQVKGLNKENSWEDFTQDDCNSQWVAGTNWYSDADWNSTVAASCENGGMAVLMNGGSTMEKRSFYEVANMTYNGYTYSAQDMMTSSINGFLQYGFNYNATDSFVAKLLDPTAENLNNISQYVYLEPTSPGMYNLPVCQLYDLGVVPNSIAGPWPKGQYPSWPSQTQPCSCMSDDANVTIGGTTSYFRDFAGDGITTQLNSLIKDDGNYGTDCYVAAKNTIDCVDFPELCTYPFPPS